LKVLEIQNTNNQDWIRGSIGKKKRLEPESKVPFEIKNQTKFI
jgi:hypothetical protein